MSAFLFEDTFDLKELDVHKKEEKDANGAPIYEKVKKFNKVSRLLGKSENYDTEITLDVNTEIYPVATGDKFKLVLTHTLDDGGEDIDYSRAESTLLSQYELAMHGKVFRYAEEKGKAVVYVSYGGLLMALRGEPRTLRPQMFDVEREIFLLMRKV